MPHSRFNGLDETALAGKGYTTLARSDEAGVDLFIKDEGSLLIFLQGHPEYEADSLAREFRRDLWRYLKTERAAPPDPPSHFFGADVLTEVEALIERSRCRSPLSTCGSIFGCRAEQPPPPLRSLARIPCKQGKEKGISRFSSSIEENLPKSACDFMALRPNSLAA
jgi:hypothetical protein